MKPAYAGALLAEEKSCRSKLFKNVRIRSDRRPEFGGGTAGHNDEDSVTLSV